jgi:hypothetical protein
VVPEKDGVRRRVYGHSWSLVSGASTAVNCLVIYVAKRYEPPRTAMRMSDDSCLTAKPIFPSPSPRR